MEELEFKPKGFRISKEELEFLAGKGLKWCAKCSTVKQTTKFGKDKHKSDGLTTKCLECNKKQCSKYHENNSEKICERKKQYREENPELTSEIKKKCYYKHHDKNLEYSRNYSKNNHDKIYTRNKEYVKNNPEKVKLWRNTRFNFRYKHDTLFKTYVICRRLIRRAINTVNEEKIGRTIDLLGYSPLELKMHIESKFKEGMTWDNFGKWHIDHIIPISVAQDLEQALFLSKLENLQPLWADENLKKSNKS